MISDILASVLRSGRSDFNARFSAARQLFPGLDSAAFTVVLQDLVDPAVCAVAAIDPDSAAETASAAYDVALEIAGQNLAGTGVHSMVITEGWRRLLPAAARHLAEEPRRILSAVSNALYHLATTPGSRPDLWIHDLSRLVEECAGVDQFLTLGKVAAWRAGLAHYRTQALALLDKLPEKLALALLESPATHSWIEIRTRLGRDPWFDPAKPDEGQGERLRPVLRCGAFRGFGGLFIEPPRVSINNDTFLVQSGHECWMLTADCFGATFHHCDPALFILSSGHNMLPPEMQISGSSIRMNGYALDFGLMGEISSAAATAETLALTSSLTHTVTLVAIT